MVGSVGMPHKENITAAQLAKKGGRKSAKGAQRLSAAHGERRIIDNLRRRLAKEQIHIAGTPKAGGVMIIKWQRK